MLNYIVTSEFKTIAETEEKLVKMFRLWGGFSKVAMVMWWKCQCGHDQILHSLYVVIMKIFRVLSNVFRTAQCEIWRIHKHFPFQSHHQRNHVFPLQAGQTSRHNAPLDLSEKNCNECSYEFQKMQMQKQFIQIIFSKSKDSRCLANIQTLDMFKR